MNYLLHLEDKEDKREFVIGQFENQKIDLKKDGAIYENEEKHIGIIQVSSIEEGLRYMEIPTIQRNIRYILADLQIFKDKTEKTLDDNGGWNFLKEIKNKGLYDPSKMIISIISANNKELKDQLKTDKEFYNSFSFHHFLDKDANEWKEFNLAEDILYKYLLPSIEEINLRLEYDPLLLNGFLEKLQTTIRTDDAQKNKKLEGKKYYDNMIETGADIFRKGINENCVNEISRMRYLLERFIEIFIANQDSVFEFPHRRNEPYLPTKFMEYVANNLTASETKDGEFHYKIHQTTKKPYKDGNQRDYKTALKILSRKMDDGLHVSIERGDFSKFDSMKIDHFLDEIAVGKMHHQSGKRRKVRGTANIVYHTVKFTQSVTHDSEADLIKNQEISRENAKIIFRNIMFFIYKIRQYSKKYSNI